MNSTYIKFDNIDFLNETYKILAEDLLKEITKLESRVVEAEELYENAKEKFGESKAKLMYQNYLAITSKTLQSLKITFWYYTGYSPSKVIIDLTDEEKSDIFNF